MTDAPEQIWAWPFAGWEFVGGQWGKGRATMPDTNEYIRADIHKALEAENERLREALKPFSEESVWWFTRNYSASDTPVEGFKDYQSVMTCGDLFRARAALKGDTNG